MLRWFVVAVGGWLCCAGAALAQEDKSPLARFSSDASVVIRLSEFDKTLKQIAELVEAIQPGFGEQVEQQGGLIGVALSNPTLAGVDREEDWFIIVYASGEGEPNVVFAIPATDADAMKDAIDSKMTAVVDGDWVYYADKDKGVPEAVKAEDSIEENMSEEGDKLFYAGDLAIYINVAQLAEAYEDEIDAAQTQGHAAIEQLGEQLGPQGEQIKPMLAVYSTMLDKALAALGDAEELTIALNADKTGLKIEDYAVFEEDSSTSKALATHPRSKMALLGKLPGDSVGYLGISADIQALMQWGMKYNAEMLKDEAQKAAMTKALDGMKGVKFSGMATSFDIGDAATGLLKAVGVTECGPVDTLKKQMRAITKSMGTIEAPGLKQETTLAEDAETIGGTKIDVITMKQEVEDPQAAAFQTIAFGPDGMVARVAYLDKGYLQAFGGGKELMEAALKTYKSASATSPAVAFSKTLLPESNLVWMLDLPTLAVRGAKQAGNFEAQLPFDPSELDALEVAPSFMGGAIGIEKDAIRAKFSLPVENAQNIAKLVMFGVQKQQGQ